MCPQPEGGYQHPGVGADVGYVGGRGVTVVKPGWVAELSPPGAHNAGRTKTVSQKALHLDRL